MKKKPQVLAGIMGGQNSSIIQETHKILLEVAVWDSYDVHQTSVRLGLRSDSSLRYEKSLDPYSIEGSLWRLCQLICEVHPQAKVCGRPEIYYKEPFKPLCLETSAPRIADVLGYPLEGKVGRKLVCQIFANLGFAVAPQQEAGKEASDTFCVQLPSYRTSKDISLEEDLIEEIGRIIGYDNIVPQSPLATICPTSLGDSQQLAREIRNFLVLNGGAQEVLSYPLIGAKLLERAHWPRKEPSLCLANPLNPEHDRMRESLIPSHLELVERNAHHNRLHQFCIFEIGRSYHQQLLEADCQHQQQKEQQPDKTLRPQEEEHLIISSYNDTVNPLLELRNLCERLLRYLLGIDTLTGRNIATGWYNSWGEAPEQTWPQFIPQSWIGIHPRERLCWQIPSYDSSQSEPSDRRYSALTRAWIFSIHPSLLQEWKLKGKLAMACIPLGTVTLPKDAFPARKRPAIEFQPLQRFPTVEFDCTVILAPQVLAASAVHALEQGALQHRPHIAGLLQTVRVRSVYSVPNSTERWLTLQVVFANRSGTLQGQEIKQLEDQVVTILRDAGFPLKMEHAQ